MEQEEALEVGERGEDEEVILIACDIVSEYAEVGGTMLSYHYACPADAQGSLLSE